MLYLKENLSLGISGIYSMLLWGGWAQILVSNARKEFDKMLVKVEAHDLIYAK